MDKIFKILKLLIFVVVPLIIVYLIDAKKDPMNFLTAALVGITAYYAWATQGQLEQAKESTRAAIRPLIIATRLSKEGEIGAFAGEEGLNLTTHLINVGSGHAHRVNIKFSPPAEAYAIVPNGMRKESTIYVIQGVEMPINSKRMWNTQGAFCNQKKWHYMYAEYEDMEGNQYYTMQSGYNVKTGEIKELKQKIRKRDDDMFWKNEERQNWLDDIDSTLKIWAQQQRDTFQKRTS